MLKKKKLDPITNKINVALIGSGRISYKHLSAIADLNNDIKLVAVCDPLIDKLKDSNKALSEQLI